MKSPQRIFLARHGQSEGNRYGIMQGSLDIPLSEEGRAQARALGRRLAKTPIDRIISSDLGRALETAKIVASFQGLGCELVVDPRLRELDAGDFEGRRFEEIKAMDPKEAAHLYERPAFYAPPQGESVQALRARIEAFLAELLEAPRASSLLISHGLWIQVFLHLLSGKPFDAMETLIVDNCALTEISLRSAKDAKLVRFNEGATLSKATSGEAVWPQVPDPQG